MNDFTKEELIKIQDCVNHQCYTQPFGAIELARICEKIQSMINNYCEHKHDIWPLYTNTGECPIAAFCFECNSEVSKEFLKDDN
jgi:hypothetical protein